MYKDKTQLRKDGHRTLESGMNSGRNPVLLTQTECAFASNVSFRNGFPTNRQKWMPVPLKDGGGLGSGLAGFQTSNFQGAAVYDISDYAQHIMVMAGGTLYQLDAAGSITVTGTFNDGASNASAPQCWFAQPDVYFVIQDGTSTPIVMQGLGTARRATTTEVPVGQAMAYGQGRLWMAQGRQVVAGDILGGPTSVISFTENTYISEAAFFGVPLNCGNVVGLIFMEQGDTQTGQGELLLFARKAAFSIQASVPRAATQTQPGWQGTPGMQKVALTNVGGTGWRNLLAVNQDIFFRSKDGWRTFRTARNEAYGWGGAPISNEMHRILYTDSLQLLDYASSCIFKNRVFLTCTPSPYPKNLTGGGAIFSQLCVLDLQVISSVINRSNLAYEFSPYFSQRGSPAYDGVWNPPSGLEILQVLQTEIAREERLLAFMYNTSTQKTEIWELVDYLAFDNQTVPVVSQIETKTYDFKLPDALKELRRGELYFTSTQASIDLTVEFRSDGYPNWVNWGSCTLPGHQQPCNLDVAACQSPGCPVEGYWFQWRLPTPPNTCDPNTNKLIRVGFHFQLRITWSGPATLLMVMVHAEELVEDPNGGCCGVPSGAINYGVT
jgi:hypothetical protein